MLVANGAGPLGTTSDPEKLDPWIMTSGTVIVRPAATATTGEERSRKSPVVYQLGGVT